ncbi:carboxypeptidase-like regulatory domain-containing protein, partial [Ohtaekwangia sp.]|uniref:carboxypeptidase-like regulatory domain-containing protein n=1 Tax=Ohtaekwangia sp. TaxID=2066019 RepID=UPI002FDC7E51
TDKTEIPFVNITSKEEKNGSSSYLDGSFIITVTKFPATLVFSHVNYGKTEITFTSNKSTAEVMLTPLPVILDEVTINALDPERIVSECYQNIASSPTRVMAKGFYRQWTKNDDIYSEILESFYTSKITPKGIEAATIAQGRYAVKDNREKGLMAYQNFSVFTNTFPLVQTTERSFITPLRKDAEEFFVLKLQQVIDNPDSSKVYVVAFTPKQNNSKPGFCGQLFIDDRYNLIRFKGSIDDSRFQPLTTIDPQRVSSLKLTVDAFCDNRVGESILLENMKVDLQYKYRYNDKDSRQIQTSSFYFTYEMDTMPSGSAVSHTEPAANDYAAINQTAYDDTFWENTKVLSQTPIEKEIIKQFRKSKLFRKIFQK